ncbi:MAG: hypothetical protein ACNA7V_00225 [Bacteroidales bacterium]
MKTSLALITVFTLFFLFSCNSSDKDPRRTQKAPQAKPNKEQIAPVSSEQAQPAEAETAEQSSTEQNQAEVMLNPPHGQPYHRCDIPVGAPLNTPPANAGSQTSGNSAVNTATRTTKNPTAPTIENAMKVNPSQTQNAGTADKGTKPKLNPAHGQPYHRCDIPVGSPLP